MNITKRQKEEEQLRFQAHILKNINQAVIVTTPAGIVTYMNQFAEIMYGWAATDALGKDIIELIVPQISSVQAQEIISSLREGRNWQGEFMTQRKDGSQILVHVVNTPIMDEHGNITAIAGISSDITERKALEKMRMESEARLQLAQSVAKVGSWETDLSTLEVIWSEQTYEIFDLDSKTFHGSHQAFLEFVHPLDRAKVDDAFNNSFNYEVYNTIEHRIVSAKGVTKYVEERWKIFRNNQNQPIRAVGICQDITDRKQAEKIIENSEAELKEAQSMAKLGRWELNLITNQLNWSDSVFEIFEIDKEHFGATYEAYLNATHPDDRQLVNDTYSLSIENKQPYEIEHRLQMADGRIKHIRGSGRTEYDENGKALRSVGIVQDVTAQRHIEETLRENQARFEMALIAGNQGAWLTDWQKKTNVVDERWAAMLGYSLEEVGEKLDFWESRVHPDDLKKLYSDFERHERGEIPMIDVDVRARTKNGEWKWISDRAQILKRMPNGQPWIMAGVHTDITDRKQSELALQESEKKFRGLFENLIDEVHLWKIVKDKTGKITGWQLVDANPAALKAWGKSINEISGKTANEIFGADAHEQFMPIVEEIFKTNKPYHWENYFAPTDQYLYMESIPFGDYFISTGKDITEQKKIQNELETSNTRLNIAKEAAQIGIWEFFIEDQKLIWDDKMFELFNVSKSTFSGTYEAWRSTVHPDDLERCEQELQNAIASGQSFNSEFRIIWQDKSIHHIIGMAESIRDTNGKSYKMIGVNYDITERKQAEIKLKEAKEKAEESDRLKTAFLANMSHEIRTPMNGIMGFANLLQKQGITPQKEAEYLAMIQKSGHRMLNIINDIISISKIEAGEIQVTLSPTNINEKLEFIRAFFDPEASAKGIQIVVTSALPKQKAIVTTDPEKVYGTLANLVKNAIKFTNSGTIELGCREKPEQAELEFFVKDKGIGIPTDKLDFIFDRFRQVNDSSTRNYEGAGLGLAISKAQVEKLGGKIWVDSEIGKGSTFYFTIPCQRDLLSPPKQAEEPEFKIKEQTQKGIKIVLAEDEFISAAFLKTVLKINGNEIIHATTGTEAVEIVRNNPDTDVVLMDLSMPELNGYEATSQIRQFNKTAVIIIQSGHTFEENRKQAAEAGCTDFISKPVNENELLRMIEKHLRKSADYNKDSYV